VGRLVLYKVGEDDAVEVVAFVLEDDGGEALDDFGGV